MSDRIDPRDLPARHSPAYVEGRDSLYFVADATVEDTGWLRVTEWNGDTVLFPPRECGRVRLLEVESVEDEFRRRLADEDLRQNALPDDTEPEVSR